jgi:hypothetical protein
MTQTYKIIFICIIFFHAIIFFFQYQLQIENNYRNERLGNFEKYVDVFKVSKQATTQSVLVLPSIFKINEIF